MSVRDDIKLLKEIESSMKPSTEFNRRAVIIKGNPEKMIGMEDLAEQYYLDIAEFIESFGFSVEYDDGLAYTCPNLDVAFWVAHSRGVDREVCIEPEDSWRFLEFGTLDGYIHSVDAEWASSIDDMTTTSELPPIEHFEFIDEQKDAIEDIINSL